METRFVCKREVHNKEIVRNSDPYIGVGGIEIVRAIPHS